MRGRIERFLNPVGKALVAIGLTPMALTVLGLVLCVAGAAAVGWHRPVLGGWLFLAGSALDGLDGTVARLTGKASARGALLDSVFDRLGETALWAGLAAHLVDEARLVLICVVSLGGALITSYLRAKAEINGTDGRGGMVGRGERVILLTVALVFDLTVWILPVLALLIWLTVFQRFRVIWKRLES